jgi:sporulation protein YlmC with PRC-barrel domain/CBS domain-containing protein
MNDVLTISTSAIPTSASMLMGTSVFDPAGVVLGRIQEFAVDVSQDGTRVEALVLRPTSGKKPRILPVREVKLAPGGRLETLTAPKMAGSLEHYLLLDRDLLDQQIIDVDGHKVVRVNDVNLTWDTADGTTVLLIPEVEVGTQGAVRRLLKGLPVSFVEGVAGRIKMHTIPWGCVDLIDRDPARRVRLKIGQERLSKLHPSDIAEILEELTPAEREAVFSSLPDETAAEALEEIEPKLQKELLQRLDSEHAADIIEEMDPGAAADILSELSEEESEAILEEMEPEERQEVEELLEFSADSAAGQMTTDFVSVPKDATVAQAVAALREFEGDPDTVTEIYLTGEHDKFEGAVTMASLVLAAPDTVLSTLTDGHRRKCGLHAKQEEVAEIFDKYNLRSLPVLDHEGRIAGAIHAEQVIAQLREA